MTSNLINSYVQNNNKASQYFTSKKVDDIELVTTRKAKPDFDVHRELANRTFIKPLPPQGGLVNDGFFSAPAVFVEDLKYDMRALKSAIKGDANDHQLGKLNDLGMKLGGLGIATYLFSIKKAPVTKGMEFVGLGSFFASMALWPKLALEIPAKIIHGFNPFMMYEDSQKRKKPFFQDNQYLAYDMIPDDMIERVGNRTGIPKNMPNRRDAVQEKMRQIALQNNTMWMLTAGFATPVMSSLICNVLEPHFASAYNFLMNKRIDNILVDFASAQEKYKPKTIERDVKDFLEMYKGRAVDKKLLDKLAAILTQELNPIVEKGVRADLGQLFKGGEYRVAQHQIKPLKNNMVAALKNVLKDDAVSQNVEKIIPTVEQFSQIFEKYRDKQYTVAGLGQISNELINVVEMNINNLNQSGVKIPKVFASRIVKTLLGKDDLSSPITTVLMSSPTNILDDEAQNVIKAVAKRMTVFSAENNALSMYSFKKLASAPDTAKGKFWNDVAKSFIKILEITPDEIARTRFDRNLVAELVSSKMQAIAADRTKYTKVMKDAAAKFSEIARYVKPDDMTGKYIKQLETSCNSAATDFRTMGLTKTAERLIGINGNEAGSLLGISRFFVSDDLMDLKNSFARFFNAQNFYRAVHNDPELKMVNKIYDISGNVTGEIKPSDMVKEIKEEIFALSDFLATSGRISDYSVKFEFLRNLRPNKDDRGALSFNNDGTIKFAHYNKKKLETDGVFINSDTVFFKRVMNLLFGGDVQPETDSALSEYAYVKRMLTNYRKGMIEKVGDMENFVYPSKVVHDLFNKDGGRIYSSSTPNERSLCTGAALDEMIANACKQSYNTRRWLKVFGGFGAGLLGVTVLSQFFFGRVGKNHNKNKV